MFLAEVNVGRLRRPLDALPEFRDGVAPVEALAEATEGYLGRRVAVGVDVPGIASDPQHPLLVNVSLWTGYQALHDFAYRGVHGRYLSARSRWFLPVKGPTTALWWQATAEPPTVEAVIARLVRLRREGPTRAAFTVLRRFEPDGTPHVARRGRPGRRIPGV